MQRYLIEVTNEPDMEFDGEILAQVANVGIREAMTVLTIYRTKGGHIICYRLEKDYDGKLNGACTFFMAQLLTPLTIKPVFDFFGKGTLAKQLYQKAGIPCMRHIP